MTISHAGFVNLLFARSSKPSETSSAIAIQRKYYTDTAPKYDSMHAHEGGTDPSITKYAYALLRMLGARSVLDVGTATGRGLSDFKRAMPDLFICGIEPVDALIRQGVREGYTSGITIVCGTGEALPFPDRSFDVVCEFAALHHAANPNAIVQEMLRVARKAVIICDSNRFGQGPPLARLIKLILWKTRLWAVFNYVRTRGKGYMVTEGDGLAYSYSVYDSFDLLALWADRIVTVPCGEGKHVSWFHPLLTSAGVLLCAIKEESSPHS
jgi:ubiquinone/menaquinone biosynthesis C-methylase UbiE